MHHAIRASLALLGLLLCVGPAGAQSANTLTPQQRSEGWQLLFDGQTLTGWHSAAPPQRAARAGAPPAAQAAPGAPGQTGTPGPCTRAAAAVPPGGSHWEVVDGAITGCGEPAGYLVSDGSYRNFVLSLDFKCSGDTNSGVFVRSPMENGGYEVQIWNRQPAGYNTGAIVGTAKTSRDFDIRPDDWNHYEITADGDHLVVVLNGQRTLDVHDARFAEGNIRLQYQLYPIAFRNIRLRPLP